jgi:iron-sulfur cluster repair protein YtfE (RIC family)
LGEPDDVIELLTRDHGVLRGLLQQLDSEYDRGQLSVLFQRIVHELASHEAAEERVVFPAFRAAVPTEEREARHRMGEHEEINELLAEMRVLTPDDPGFEKRASALCLELEAHFTAEEEDVFPRLGASLSRQQLVELAEQVITVKQTAPPFPEPEFTDHVHAVRAPKPGGDGDSAT